MVAAVRIGARQKGHHMRARGMGDPRFIAGDAIAIVRFHRTRTQGAQIRPGIWLCENRSGKRFAAGDFGQPFFFLVFCAAA